MNDEDKELMRQLRQALCPAEEPSRSVAHPDDELLAGYADGVLSEEKQVLVECHLALCSECRHLLATHVGVHQDASASASAQPEPAPMTAKIRSLLERLPSPVQTLRVVIEILREGLRVIDTNGLALPVPAPVLASRSGDELVTEGGTVQRFEFKHARVNIELKKEASGDCRIAIHAFSPGTEKYLDQVRATLSSQEAGLESNVGYAGPIVFEGLPPGEYAIDISSGGSPMGNIELALSVGNNPERART